MATKRDLVEAHSFNRRRLVTAFLSGAPGGREVEPVRYGRTLIGGAVVAALVVAGAAVAGFIKPAVPQDWTETNQMVMTKEGAKYLVMDGRVHPVLNATSARLALSASGDPLQIVTISEDALREVELDAPIGIPEAPDTLPRPEDLVATGWLACTNDDGGLRTSIHTEPRGTAVPGGGLVVESAADEALWLVAGPTRHRLPKASDDVLRSLGLLQDSTPRVRAEWLNLIPEGSPLAALDLEGAGKTSSVAQGELRTIGTPVEVTSSRRATYVLTDDGLLPVGEFAFRVHAALSGQAPVQVASDPSGFSNVSPRGIVPADWPGDTPVPLDEAVACVMLAQGADDPSRGDTVLAVPQDDALPQGDRVDRVVETGHGALVRVSPSGVASDDAGIVFVDQLARRFDLADTEDVRVPLVALGFGDVPAVGVRTAWANLLGPGVELSRTKALTKVSG